MGLMLAYKKRDIRYFDWYTDKEFPKNEINEHPRWYKYEYDNNGNVIYQENSDGSWAKWEYNNNGNEIYYEQSNGYWIKKEYDNNGNLIFTEDNDGYIDDDENQIQEGLMLPYKLRYRYFEIYVCYGYENDNSDADCLDGYSAFVKIPAKDLSDFEEGWEFDDYFSREDGEDIIKWMIKNNEFDKEDWDAIDYIHEIDKDEYERVMGVDGIQEGLMLSYKKPKEYRFFEINVCLSYDYIDGEYECISDRIKYVKIPQKDLSEWPPIYNDRDFTRGFTYLANEDGREVIYKAIKHNQFSSADLDNILWIEEITEEEYNNTMNNIQEGLMLSKKIYQPKYFDFKTNQEFSYEDIDKHPEWYKEEYDNNENTIYREDDDGFWEKYEYNDRGKITFIEDSDGYWQKLEYDIDGNEIYFEDSCGEIQDNRGRIQEGLMLPYKQYSYRYFSINFCFQYDYNDEPHECLDGYSIYVKIPIKDIPNLGPSQRVLKLLKHEDEMAVVRWAVDNGDVDEGEVPALVEVIELTEEEYDQDMRETELTEEGGLSDTLGQNTSQNIPKWESGISRGHANPIDYNKPWESGISRGHANSLFEGLMLGYKKFPDKYLDSLTLKEFPKSEINKHPRWHKQEYDNNGNIIYEETYYGYWTKWEYDNNGNKIYYKNSKGYWIKREYDEYGNEIYYENSDGYWEKWEYDEYGNEIYYENSDGQIDDRRNNIQENKNNMKLKLLEILTQADISQIKDIASIEANKVKSTLQRDIKTVDTNLSKHSQDKSTHLKNKDVKDIINPEIDKIKDNNTKLDDKINKVEKSINDKLDNTKLSKDMELKIKELIADTMVKYHQTMWVKRGFWTSGLTK